MGNIPCPKCGEAYSDTYRKCPFCQEEAALKKGKTLHRRGRRLEKKQRSSGAGGIMLLLSVVVIAGVVGYVFFGEQLADFMGIRTEGNQDLQYDDVLNHQNQSTDDTQSGDQGDENSGGESLVDPDPVEPAGPLTLSQSDITIPSGETARLIATGGTESVTWSSSNENIATVTDGAVVGVAGGTVIITAVSGEETVSCTVTVTGDPWINPVQLTLNKTDVTLPASDPPFRLTVSGTDSTVVWESSNSNVATVSADGLVTRVGSGRADITASVDGQVLTCIVRVP